MDDHQDRAQAARRILAQRLETLQLAGVEQVGKVRAALNPREPAAVSSSAANWRPSAPAHSSPSARIVRSMLSSPADSYPADLSSDPADRQELLQQLNEQVRACTLCRELSCSRKQTVFGVGSAQPRVVFFGEAPGADEDRQG